MKPLTIAFRAALCLTIARVSWVGAQRPAAPDSIRLTLADAIARAEREATPIILGQDSLRVSGARVLESYGRFLPDVVTGASALVAQGNTLLSSTALIPTAAGWHTGALQLSTSLNVFNGFRDRAALHASVYTRDASAYSLERARQQVAYDVLQAYFQVVLDRRLAEVARANFALSTTRQGQLEDEVRVGTRAPPDLYRQRAQTAADEASVVDASARTQSDMVSLVQRLRLNPTDLYAIAEPLLDTMPLPADSLAVELLAAQALRDRPDLHAAQSRMSSSQAALQEANGLYLPSVVLGADYFLTGRVYDWERQQGVSLLNIAQRPFLTQLSHQGLAVFSLGVVVPVFDRFETPFAIERARADFEQSRLASEDTRLRVLGDIRRGVDDYQAGVLKLRAGESGLTSAQEAFDAVTGRFDAGLATFVDVQTAQAALTQARELRESAAVNLAFQREVLRFVTGTRLDRL
jgi:outer membrane protein